MLTNGRECVKVSTHLMFTCWLTLSNAGWGSKHTWLFLELISAWMRLSGRQTLSLWFIKGSRECNVFYLFYFFYFGAQSSCDWVMAFLPDICSSVVVVNMNIMNETEHVFVCWMRWCIWYLCVLRKNVSSEFCTNWSIFF